MTPHDPTRPLHDLVEQSYTSQALDTLVLQLLEDGLDSRRLSSAMTNHSLLLSLLATRREGRLSHLVTHRNNPRILEHLLRQEGQTIITDGFGTHVMPAVAGALFPLQSCGRM
jgi:hypothetical protein